MMHQQGLVEVKGSQSMFNYAAAKKITTKSIWSSSAADWSPVPLKIASGHPGWLQFDALKQCKSFIGDVSHLLVLCGCIVHPTHSKCGWIHIWILNWSTIWITESCQFRIWPSRQELVVSAAEACFILLVSRWDRAVPEISFSGWDRDKIWCSIANL